MKCHKCQFENVLIASYCQKCGEKISESEKDNAYNKTMYGKIDKAKKVKDILTLDIITGNIFFKIISLLIVLGIGIYYLIIFGMNTKILNSNDYNIFYNKNDNEYYLIVDDTYDSINVSLYRPNRLKEMKLYHYNYDDTLISDSIVNKDDIININTYQNDYYIIESNYGSKNKEELKVFVYHNSDI